MAGNLICPSSKCDGRPQVLPIAEMTFVDYPRGKPKIVGYAAKWDEDGTRISRDASACFQFGSAEHKWLCEIALRCWEVFWLQGYARVDIRLDHAGTPWVLEVNANPCLTPDAGFVAAAQQGGLTHGNSSKTLIPPPRNGPGGDRGCICHNWQCKRVTMFRIHKIFDVTTPTNRQFLHRCRRCCVCNSTR